jgi:hypothetical protein
VRLANLIKGLSVEESAHNVVRVTLDIEQNGRRGAYYSVKKLKPAPDLKLAAGDSGALWDLTEDLLKPYLKADT